MTRGPELYTPHVISNREIARRSAVAALTARREYEVPLNESCCVFDILEKIGVDLWFVRVDSLEGMYVNSDPPTVLLGADRPNGRQRQTAAHELGHHWFRHGTRIDEIKVSTSPHIPIDELQANFFASFFLMPKSLVVSAFSRRGWDARTATAEQIYIVSGWLGVGFSALVTHMRFSLGLLSASQAVTLLGMSLKQIRQRAMGASPLHDGIVVDEYWTGRPIDAAVGDMLRVPVDTKLEGDVGVTSDSEYFRFVLLTSPGLARLDNNKWASYLRVRERGFAGRAIFRHVRRVD